MRQKSKSKDQEKTLEMEIILYFIDLKTLKWKNSSKTGKEQKQSVINDRMKNNFKKNF